MPLRLEIKKKLSARSERVKCTDFHPTEPWILASLYSGHVFIWNYLTQSMLKSIEVCELPVRCAKFIPSRQWIITGSDDMMIRIYNYNTSEKIKSIEAHSDYIRSIAIHPTLPYVLSSSDDMTIKLWDYERNWENTQLYEGHSHYVMQVEFNPKDSSTFASASLDRTIKIWGLTTQIPHFSLEGHERGVNCVSYYRGGDRPYLISGADDFTVKIWDYQTKTCVSTLEGHTNNVSAVCFHPELPIILSGSEDGTVRIWHSSTYKLENTLNYGMERVWCISTLKGSNAVGIGYDDGTIMIKIGHESPVVSMEKGGKVVWAVNHEIVTANLKAASDVVNDGDRLPLQSKELGSCELYPQSISHSPNGRLLCACGDGQYIIYTSLALKNKSYGTALEFVWAADSGVYATRESTTKVTVFNDFKVSKTFRPVFAAEQIFGGQLFGIRGSDFIDFYQWSGECQIVRRIDVCPKKVFWSESGELVALCCESSYYVLRYNATIVNKYIETGTRISEQGIEGAFELEKEIGEVAKNGVFIGDCFLYITASNRLCYYIGGTVEIVAHLQSSATSPHANKSLHLLGYLPKENKIYLMDKQYNVYVYTLLLSVLIYQTAIVRGDMEAAAKALASVPQDQHNKMARFIECQGMKREALELTNDPEHKFELAMALKEYRLAQSIVEENDPENETKWRELGDAALNTQFDLPLVKKCYTAAKDCSGLLLLYTSTGDADGIAELAKMAKSLKKYNIAFTCLFLLKKVDECVDLLTASGRVPEAAFFARTYVPTRLPEIVKLWKEDLSKVSTTAAEALSNPEENEEMFNDYQIAIQCEEWARMNDKELEEARVYGEKLANGIATPDIRDLIAEMKEGKLQPSQPRRAVSPQRQSPPVASPLSQKFPNSVPSATSPPKQSPTKDLLDSINNAQPAPKTLGQVDILSGHFSDLSTNDQPFIGQSPTSDLLSFVSGTNPTSLPAAKPIADPFQPPHTSAAQLIDTHHKAKVQSPTKLQSPLKAAPIHIQSTDDLGFDEIDDFAVEETNLNQSISAEETTTTATKIIESNLADLDDEFKDFE